MSRLRVVPIVEGHGEQRAVRRLLERLWYELLGGEFIDVLSPIRTPRQRLIQNKDEALTKAIGLGWRKLAASHPAEVPSLVLILLDADHDPPCALGPRLLKQALEVRPDQDISCVLAKVEYETWFVAAAESLSDYLDVSATGDLPIDPEARGCGKRWIRDHFRQTRYSETIDQPKLTAQMDLQACRKRSPSFDKLCRDLETRFAASR